MEQLPELSRDDTEDDDYWDAHDGPDIDDSDEDPDYWQQS